VISKDAGPEQVIGVQVDQQPLVGFKTPSRKLEFYSKTLKDWQWPEFTVPGYIRSHVHWERIDKAKQEFALVPTFRLPTLIHTRSGNAKWLYETAHRNPLWIHPKDAEQIGLESDQLLRVNTEIGYFVIKAWTTEGILPGVVACSHHLGRWRLHQESGGDRWSTGLVDLLEPAEGQWLMRQVKGIEPFKSEDPESERIWWKDAGVHQNMTFPVHPDPISGMHCWHQKVRLEVARPEDRYGDVFVDTNKAHDVYKEWLKMTHPAPGPEGLRRPLWLQRPLRPVDEAFRWIGTR